MDSDDRTTPDPVPPEGEPHDPRARVGSTLAGRYELVEYLGGGAQGEVYAGIHQRIGRRDAIKVLKPHFRHDRDAVARFTRGAANASRISHPNVCTVYDFGETEDGLPFLACEFVEGESLGQLLERRGPLAPGRAVAIAAQVASALEAAHELDIVHRDLKPDNIMLLRDAGGREKVKVVDFDIAKGSKEGLDSGITRGGWVVGTPQYMSPEQLSEDALDGRSDIYSLAVVLFKTLTGRIPTRSNSTQEMMVERLTQDALRLREVAPNLEVPERFEEVLSSGLARRREERPRRAVDFVAELRAALDGDPAVEPLPRTEVALPGQGGVSRPEPSTGSGDGARARRGLRYALAGLVGVALLVTGITLFSSGDPAVPATPDPDAGDEAAPDPLRIEPGELRLEATSGDAPPSAEVRVESTSGGSASVALVLPPGVGWLAARLDRETTPATLTVEASPEGLEPGVYTDTLRLTTADGSVETPLAVALEVTERPGPSPANAYAEAQRLLLLVTSPPSRGALLSARDTAAALWENASLTANARGLAAYVHSVAISSLGAGDAEVCLWARRAVDLVPSDATFRTQVDGCRP